MDAQVVTFRIAYCHYRYLLFEHICPYDDNGLRKAISICFTAELRKTSNLENMTLALLSVVPR